MPRRWRGVLCVEGEQTGDGRVIAEGALSWAELPLPLGWLTQEQHGDLLPGAYVVGNIDTITRDGLQIIGEGVIDDASVEGAELCRRMDAGTAPLGNRYGVSIDPDDYEMQIVSTEEESDDEGLIILASGGQLPTPTVTAAAGDADPTDSGTVLFEDSVDSILMRFTRLRIRGATACAIAAFANCYIELTADTAFAEGDDDEAAPITDHAFVDEDGDGACDYCVEEGDDGECAQMCGASADEHAPADDDESVTAAAAPVAPPSEWFTLTEPSVGDERYVEQPDGGMAVPLTITDDGQVFGHLARWGQCHTGFPGACVEPPDSMRAYADFMVGETVCADGVRFATGVLTVGTDHAAARLLAPDARDHYAHTGLAWADVRVSSGELGPWVSGSLRPGLSDDVIRVLRASSLSGDWRRIGGHLELIAALSVNSPGFPVAREALAAASLPAPAEFTQPIVGMLDGEQIALVAAGAVHRCADCAARARAERELRVNLRLADDATMSVLTQMAGALGVIERRTRHLRNAAAADALARISNR